MKAERRLQGLGISPGIAIGPVFVTDDNIAVPEYHVDKDQIDAELERFAAAVALSTKQLRKLKTKADSLPGTAKEEVGYLLDAHLHMLGNSRLVRGAERRIESERINAERAVDALAALVTGGF
ncbi:MAG TPA: phosphoenolpyruvate-utilizing N-terminal domain-containing protein, partial [Stellaceae bacterium]|nr:phosphoenolpyruvate-utilizing N-terminal domain-containing protein [Stellaceae bacterium]